MKPTNKTATQASTAEQRAAIEQELRIAKEYWMRKVQPHIANRILRDIEFFIAQHEHRRLRTAVDKAIDWNHLCNVGMDVAQLPVYLDVDLAVEIFRKPDVPELFFADKLKPEILASIGAPLVDEGKRAATPDEAIRIAHDLLMAAERYMGTLPKNKEEFESLDADFDMAFRWVSFAEIEASNKETPRQLPLLPPIAQKRKGRSKNEIGEQPLSVPAIRAAVKLFLQEHTPHLSRAEYEREQKQSARLAKAGMLLRFGSGQVVGYQQWQQQNQNAIDDCLKNDRISLQNLCTMRWERFKKHWQGQQNRVLAREANKNAPKGTQ